MKIGKFDNRNKENNEELLEELLAETEDLDEKKPLKKQSKDEGSNDDEESEEEDESGDESGNDYDSEDGENEDDEEGSDEEDDSEEEDDDEAEAKRLLKEKRDKEEEDRKAALKASQREALVQQSRNKQLTDKIKQAQSLEVTDADLESEATKEGLKLDELDAFQKSMLKRTILAERKFSTVSEVIVADDKVNEWADKADEFLTTISDDPKLAKIKGHEEEFKAFAMKESRRGQEFGDLARAFLFDLPVTKKHKGSVLLKSGGGAKNVRRQLNEDDAVALRKSSPTNYMKLVKAGKIKVEI